VTSPGTPGRKHKGRNKGRSRPREYNQEFINTYDIQSSTLHMGTTDLGKTFGLVDLYKDNADLTDVYRVEKAFSKLENDAALVFHTLDDTEKRGRSSVELTRSQLNIVRKFLFLMQYRTVEHASQFIEGRFDQNTANMVEEYRVKHGLADARAVWLRNLALLLEDEHWEVATDDRLLFTAQVEYKMDAMDMQLGFYRAPPGTEFVLTENGLGLWEGAKSLLNFLADMVSPDPPNPSHFPLTRSFPVTPRLVVMLRSNLLTQEAYLIQHGVPATEARRTVYNKFSNVSYFDDLPRTPAKTTYIPPLPSDSFGWANRRPGKATPEDRRKAADFHLRGLLNGVPVGSRLRDRFIFAIDDLTEGQAQRVNTLLLTHCKETISFLTPACLVRAIDAFKKDMALTTFGKNRYESLKAKLLAEQANTSPIPTSPPISASPEAERSPRESVPTSTRSSEPEPTKQAVPMRTTLPGLKGAFNRKTRSAPCPHIPEVPLLSELPSLSTGISPNERDHLDVSNTKGLHTRAREIIDTHVTSVDSVSTIGGVVTAVDDNLLVSEPLFKMSMETQDDSEPETASEPSGGLPAEENIIRDETRAKERPPNAFEWFFFIVVIVLVVKAVSWFFGSHLIENNL